MKLLITYFEAFGQDQINATKEVVSQLQDIEGIEVTSLELAVKRCVCSEKLFNEINKKQYDAIISLGQASGRNKVSLERVAINVDDYRIKDNDGNQPVDEMIYANGENAYFTTLPIRKMYEASDPALVEISNSAGTYVCNHLFYSTLYYLSLTNRNIPYGFIHIPALPSQVMANQASMEAKVSSEVLKKMIEVLKDEVCN